MDVLYFFISWILFGFYVVIGFTLMSIPILMGLTICQCFTLTKSGNIKVAHYKSLESEYTETISQNPDDYKAYFKRGEARTALGDKVGALADYTQSLRIAPNIDAYYKRAILFLSLFYFFEWILDILVIVRVVFYDLFEEIIGTHWLR